MTMMTGELLIIVIPIVVVEVILAILALLGIHRMYGCRNGNKTVWTVIVLLIQSDQFCTLYLERVMETNYEYCIRSKRNK